MVSIQLELPQDLEEELSAEAARLGLPLPEYLVRVLSTARATEDLPKTGTELVDYWQREGLIGSRPEITDSERHARELRARAARHLQKSNT